MSTFHADEDCSNSEGVNYMNLILPPVMMNVRTVDVHHLGFDARTSKMTVNLDYWGTLQLSVSSDQYVAFVKLSTCGQADYYYQKRKSRKKVYKWTSLLFFVNK